MDEQQQQQHDWHCQTYAAWLFSTWNKPEYWHDNDNDDDEPDDIYIWTDGKGDFTLFPTDQNKYCFLSREVNEDFRFDPDKGKGPIQ